MINFRFKWANCLLIMAVLCLSSGILMSSGCKKKKSRPRSASSIRNRQKSDSAFLVGSLASGLNNLPSEVVLELKPPFPILDDAKSENGQPVLAICGPTPAVPEGPNNYISVPGGNGNFSKIGVRSGDIVRYFVKVDQESSEHGIEQIGYFELIVRRVDINNSQNALVVEQGMQNPIDFPRRIEIWRFSDKRSREITTRRNHYALKPETLIGWEPSPDESALIQLLEQTNQWLRNLTEQESTWQLEPLMAELPGKLRKTPPLAKLISTKTMGSGLFDPTEARQLQQAIWLRDISAWAKGDAFAPLDVAEKLFDWTVRNIQLDSPGSVNNIYQPWQVLMYGHGTAQQRAWVFAELCRQQQLDVVMLATGEKWWLPALLHEGQLYLFDTQLGLPLYGAKSEGIATLAELQADPTLLRKLDIEVDGEKFEYGVTAEDLKQITAWLVASPLQVSKRAALLEQALIDDNFVVLSANTRHIADSLDKLTQIHQVQMWPLPFEFILAELAMAKDQRKDQRVRAALRFEIFARRPRLWKSRVLHFQGTKPVPLAQRNDPLALPSLGHQQATELYQHENLRPSKQILARQEPTKRRYYEVTKQTASYWLGLLSYDVGKYKVAKDWFAERTLASWPNGPWTTGAQYNLARTYEKLGEIEAAIELLESIKSPQRHGNLLRAQMLSTKQGEK